MNEVIITKAVRFCAARRCWREDWDDARNRSVFGAAANLHGHNYRLEVSLAGTPDPESGMVIDLKQVKDTLQNRVVATLDHKLLNEADPFFRSHVPTTEHLILFIHRALRDAFPGVRLYRLRLWEEVDLCVEWVDPSCSD